MHDVRGLTKTLASIATFAVAKGDHPLNIITTFMATGSFGELADSWQESATLPYYVDGDFRGVRFDDSASGLSLYLFSGTEAARVAFRQSFFSHDKNGDPIPAFAAARWKEIASKFSLQEINLLPPRLDAYGRGLFLPTNWDDPLYARRYGTTVSPSYQLDQAVEQTELHVDQGRFTLAVVAGIEGSNAPTMMLVDQAARGRSDFRRLNGLLYYVVDTKTGVIVCYGQEE